MFNSGFFFTQFGDRHLSYSTVLTLKFSRYPYRMVNIQVTKRMDENKLVIKSYKTSNNASEKLHRLICINKNIKYYRFDPLEANINVVETTV
jgi:hypothetical protein